jgi:hypothetical protein
VGQGLPGDTRAAAGLAPQTGRAEVRHDHAPQTRPAADRTEHRPDRRPAGEGKPVMGYRRIHGELTKLGATVAPSTIYEILRPASIRRCAAQARRGGSSCTPGPPGSWPSTSCT